MATLIAEANAAMVNSEIPVRLAIRCVQMLDIRGRVHTVANPGIGMSGFSQDLRRWTRLYLTVS